MTKTHIASVSLDNLVEEIKSLETDLILLVVDHVVWGEWHKRFPQEQDLAGKKVFLWKASSGEGAKSFQEYEKCLEFYLEKNVHRKAHLIAFGGGATSDFAGFIAATLLRGVSWSIVPTTLLSMIDASIGGKVAINSKSGKNLVGAFHMPQNVWICTEFLRTLPEAEVLSAKGELLKYGFLDRKIFDVVLKSEGAKEESWAKVISLCAQYKQKIVDEDYQELGRRKILNLGHTFGHAIEKIYQFAHGTSVLWGLALIFEIYDKQKSLNELKNMAQAIDVPLEDPPWFHKTFPLDDIFSYLKKDKKVGLKNEIELILVNKPGDVCIEKIDLEVLYEKVRAKKDELKTFTLRS